MNADNGQDAAAKLKGREIIDAVDVTHTRKASDFEPYLRLDDVRQALLDFLDAHW